MAILVIDNGSRYREQLLRLLRPWSPQVESYRAIQRRGLEKFSAIVLSGGHQVALYWHPDKYQNELQLIRTTSLPVLGVCLGFEAIGYAFGAQLQELKQTEHGRVHISVTHTDPIFDQNEYTVQENHRWVIQDPGPDLIPLARSPDGIEVVRHRSRPIYGFQFHPELDAPGAEAEKIFTRTAARLGFA